MAHLNLVMIHPFRDGNSRLARALQTLLLARDAVLDPIFSSIEGATRGRHYVARPVMAGAGRQLRRRRSAVEDPYPWLPAALLNP